MLQILKPPYPRAYTLQQEKLLQWEARARQSERSPGLQQKRKPLRQWRPNTAKNKQIKLTAEPADRVLTPSSAEHGSPPTLPKVMPIQVPLGLASSTSCTLNFHPDVIHALIHIFTGYLPSSRSCARHRGWQSGQEDTLLVLQFSKIGAPSPSPTALPVSTYRLPSKSKHLKILLFWKPQTPLPLGLS